MAWMCQFMSLGKPLTLDSKLENRRKMPIMFHYLKVSLQHCQVALGTREQCWWDLRGGLSFLPTCPLLSIPWLQDTVFSAKTLIIRELKIGEIFIKSPLEYYWSHQFYLYIRYYSITMLKNIFGGDFHYNFYFFPIQYFTLLSFPAILMSVKHLLWSYPWWN